MHMYAHAMALLYIRNNNVTTYYHLSDMPLPHSDCQQTLRMGVDKLWLEA